jgi:hypothetical protein
VSGTGTNHTRIPALGEFLFCSGCFFLPLLLLFFLLSLLFLILNSRIFKSLWVCILICEKKTKEREKKREKEKCILSAKHYFIAS